MYDELFADVMEQIVLLKGLIIITACSVVLICLYCFLRTRKFAWTGRNRRLMGFFYHIRAKDSLVIAMCIMKLNLILSVIVERGDMKQIHIVFYVALSVFYIIHRHTIRDLLIGGFNTAVIVLMLEAASFLYSYLQNVIFNWKIAVVDGLIIVFLLAYTVFDISWAIMAMIMERHKRMEKSRWKKLSEGNVQ